MGLRILATSFIYAWLEAEAVSEIALHLIDEIAMAGVDGPQLGGVADALGRPIDGVGELAHGNRPAPLDAEPLPVVVAPLVASPADPRSQIGVLTDVIVDLATLTGAGYRVLFPRALDAPARPLCCARDSKLPRQTAPTPVNSLSTFPLTGSG